MSTETTGKIFKLKVSGVLLLREILPAPGWAVTLANAYLAGKLQAEVLPDIKGPITTREEFEKDAPEFTLTDKQVEVIKLALKNAVEKGLVFPGSNLNTILELFGITE
jgi:hypothetical protein